MYKGTNHHEMDEWECHGEPPTFVCKDKHIMFQAEKNTRLLFY